MPCTDGTESFEDLLLRYAEQGIDPVTRGKLAAHLAVCAGCRDKLKEIYQFLYFIKMLDRKVLGEKSDCPTSEEMALLADSPKSIPAARLEEIKKHLNECYRCNTALRQLIGLNKQMQRPDFEKQYPMPSRLKARVRRAVSSLTAPGAMKNEPVDIRLDNEISGVEAGVCLSALGRAATRDQTNVPVLENEICGGLADKTGVPARGEWVALFRNGKLLCRVRTGRLGGFRFGNLTQGFYEIGARANRMLVILKEGKRHGAGER